MDKTTSEPTTKGDLRNEHVTKILEENSEILRKYISRLVFNNQAFVDDIFQDVCECFLKNYAKIDRELPVKNYLFGITKNVFMNWLRKEGRIKFTTIYLEKLHDDTLLLTDDEYDIFYEELVLLCTKDLNEDEKNTFIDCFIKGLRHTEIANKRRISIGSSKMRKNRLSLKLEKKIKKLFPFSVVLFLLR